MPDLSPSTTGSSDPRVHVRPRRGTRRWLVALMATALLVVSGSGLVAFAQSGAGATRGPVFLPAGTPIYLEVRLDMPDGQVDALAEFLSAFPGFADSASFGQRLDELIDKVVGDATEGAFSYSADMKPWMTGEIGLGVMDITEAAMSGGDPEVLAGVAISDRAAADAFVTAMVAGSGVTITEEPYGDTNILSDGQMALAVTGDFVLLGSSSTTVETGIDVLAGTEASLADEASFASAFSHVPTAHLAAAYVDFATFGPLIEAAMAQSAQSGGAAMIQGMMEQLPSDMTMYLAAAPDNMTLEAFITPAEGASLPAVGESDLATRFPPDTQLFVEVRDLGSAVESGLTGLLAMMDETDAAGLAPFEDMLGTPLPGIFDFVEDAALGASLNSDGLWIGLAGEVSDEAVAAQRLERVLTLIRIVGASGDGAEVDVAETTVDDTTVTTISLPIEATTTDLPINVPTTVSVALADGTLYLGTGEFVSDALLQDPADSLAAAPGFVQAVGESGPTAAVVYADVGGLMDAIDPMLSLMMPGWADVKPWLVPLDRLVALAGVDEGVISARFSLYVD